MIRPVQYADVMARYRKPTGGSNYVAPVSAVGGVVTAYLTVSARGPELATDEIDQTWESMSKTTRSAGDALA